MTDDVPEDEEVVEGDEAPMVGNENADDDDDQ